MSAPMRTVLGGRGEGHPPRPTGTGRRLWPGVKEGGRHLGPRCAVRPHFPGEGLRLWSEVLCLATQSKGHC